MPRTLSVAGLFLGVLAFVASPAQAVPITYSFAGSGSGTLAGASFTDAAFEALVYGETDDILHPDPTLGAQGMHDLAATIEIEGVGLLTFTYPAFIFGGFNYLGNPLGNVGFGTSDGGNLISVFHSTLAGYDLASSFGPLWGWNMSLSQFEDISTNLGMLTFASMSGVTFEAAVGSSQVPEPGLLLLVGTGFACLVGWRWRHR